MFNTLFLFEKLHEENSTILPFIGGNFIRF
jgi:hypothetical protein